MFSVDDLECSRNNQILFSKISFSVQPGEIKHIQGENGVGKTTLLRCLAGLSQPCGGEIKWQGDNIYLNDRFNENRIYIGHKNAVKSSLTVEENLILSPSLQNPSSKDITQALEQIGLESKKNNLAGMLSAGQKQRLALSKLLLSPSQLWILDEPFNALDSEGLSTVQNIMSDHLAQHGMIIFTSHHTQLLNIKCYSALPLLPRLIQQEADPVEL